GWSRKSCCAPAEVHERRGASRSVRLAPPIFRLQQVAVIVEPRLDLHPLPVVVELRALRISTARASLTCAFRGPGRPPDGHEGGDAPAHRARCTPPACAGGKSIITARTAAGAVAGKEGRWRRYPG